MQKGPKHCRRLAPAYYHCLLCCRVIAWTMFRTKIYMASHLCRTNNHIFSRVRSSSNRVANPAAAYCFQLRSNVRRRNLFWIHASIRPYSRDSINRAFFHRFGYDIGELTASACQTSINFTNFIQFFLSLPSSTQQIRVALCDFEFVGVALLSFINYESRNWQMATNHAVHIVRHSIECVSIPLLDHVSAILSCAHDIRVGRHGRHHVRHIVGAADVHIGRPLQSARPIQYLHRNHFTNLHCDSDASVAKLPVRCNLFDFIWSGLVAISATLHRSQS